MPRPSKLKGWTCARPYGLFTHHLGATKPCCQRLTDGQIVCRGCRAGFDSVYKAYLPVFSPTLLHKVLILNRDEYDKVSEWDVFTEVSAWRGKEYHDPVRVQLIPEGQLSQTPSWMDGASEFDISDILIKVWNIPELTNWWDEQKQKQPTISEGDGCTPSTPKGRKASRSKPHPDIPPVLDPDTARERSAMLKRNREFAEQLGLNNLKGKIDPSTNGKH